MVAFPSWMGGVAPCATSFLHTHDGRPQFLNWKLWTYVRTRLSRGRTPCRKIHPHDSIDCTTNSYKEEESGGKIIFLCLVVVPCRRVHAQSIPQSKQYVYRTPHGSAVHGGGELLLLCVCTSSGRDMYKVIVGNAAVLGSVCVCQAPAEMLPAQCCCGSRLSCAKLSPYISPFKPSRGGAMIPTTIPTAYLS